MALAGKREFAIARGNIGNLLPLSAHRRTPRDQLSEDVVQRRAVVARKRRRDLIDQSDDIDEIAVGHGFRAETKDICLQPHEVASMTMAWQTSLCAGPRRTRLGPIR